MPEIAVDAHPLCDFCHVMLLQGAQVVRGGPTPAEVEPLSCEMHGFVLQPSPPLFGARYGFGVVLGQKSDRLAVTGQVRH